MCLTLGWPIPDEEPSWLGSASWLSLESMEEQIHQDQFHILLNWIGHQIEA